MIQITNLEMGYGDRSLFDNATLSLIMGRRYGIVGANGAGKSTFLKIIIGDIAPRKGEVSIASGLKIGTLGQDQFEYDAMNISDVTVSGNTRLFQAMKQKEELLKSGATGSEKAGRKLAELEMVIDEENGYQAEAEAAEILHGLGLSGDVKCISMGQLSGGYKIRVLLARCLFSRPDILLLDEPTNNLDIHSIIWLEEYLKSFRGLLVFISHDRRFLNNVSTDILDLDYTEVIAYKGNYDRFLDQKQLATEFRDKEIGRQEKEVADKKKFIERFSAKASKARQANSRKKQLERMPDIEIKRSTRAKPNFRFDVRQRSGKEVIKIQNISKAFGEKRVLNKVSFTMTRGQKLAVIGANGVGKSTLLKIITGNLPADSGTIEPGYALSIGYFSQNHKDLLPDDTTPYEWLYESASGETITYVRSLLGRILLTGDDVNKKIRSLSGGEATRLILSRLMHTKDNLLILDEPTNHMDMETVDAFLDALKQYEGTILFVSHDRHFTDSLADHILEITPVGYEMFTGTYSEYAAYKEFDVFSGAVSRNPTEESENKSGQGQEDYRRRKEISKAEKKLSRTEAKIAETEMLIRRLQEKLGNADLYTSEKKTELTRLQQELKTHEASMGSLLKEWEAYQSDLSNVSQ